MTEPRSFFMLMRPLNCLMGCLGVFIAALVGAGLSIVSYWPDVLIALIVIFIFMGGANALNDYYDRRTDKINHPERPIPSKLLSPKQALNFGIAALFLSFILSIFINFTSLLIVCIAAILILFYEIHFKNRGFTGNIIISGLVALLFIFGGSVVRSYDLNIILAILAFFANLSREIVKDIQDIEGDLNRITLPKSIGIPTAGKMAAAFIITAVLISPVPYLTQFFQIVNVDLNVGFQYLAIVVLADIIFINSVAEIRSDPKKASSMLKYGMFVALIAFLAAAIF